MVAFLIAVALVINDVEPSGSVIKILSKVINFLERERLEEINREISEE